MAWKNVDTGISVDVDLDDFETNQILQHLINLDFITEHEAEMIMNREDLDTNDESASDVDMECIETAWGYVARGDRKEALIWIERALGCEWMGRLTGV